MPSDETKSKNRPTLEELIIRNSFRHQQYRVDIRTWALLYENDFKFAQLQFLCEKIYESISNTDKWVLGFKGPLFLEENTKENIIYNITTLIFTPQREFREIIYNYFSRLKPGVEIGLSTIKKLKELKNIYLSKDWVKAGIEFFDWVNVDWLINFMGLCQADEIRNEKLTNEYATKVFRPSIASIETIGIGSIDINHFESFYESAIGKIENEKKLESKLNIFFYECGHLPIEAGYTINDILNTYFKETSDTISDIWEITWLWAEKTNSPIARYHITCFFLNRLKDLPKSKYENLYLELLNVLSTVSNKGKEFEWFESWKFRSDLSKLFGQFIESQLPGAQTEKIYSQAWWMSERIASIFSKDAIEAKEFREHTIAQEGYWSEFIWQIARPNTENSVLKYATIYPKSMWATSLISKIPNEFLQYILGTDLPNKNLFMQGLFLSLFDFLPQTGRGNPKKIYSFENTCLNVIEYFSLQKNDIEIQKFYSNLLSLVKTLRDENELIERVKQIDSFKNEEQLIITLAFRLLVYTNNNETMPSWEAFFKEDWITSLLPKIDSMFVVETVLISLIEIMLKKQEQWAYFLPHSFISMFQKNLQNSTMRELSFACVIISSICSDTHSALKRILLTNKKETKDLKEHWLKKLKDIYRYSSEYTKAKLRPSITILSSAP